MSDAIPQAEHARIVAALSGQLDDARKAMALLGEYATVITKERDAAIRERDVLKAAMDALRAAVGLGCPDCGRRP